MITVENVLVALAAVISFLLVVVFGIDLFNGSLFHRYSPSMDVTFLLCGVMLAYLTWHAFRDCKASP